MPIRLWWNGKSSGTQQQRKSARATGSVSTNYAGDDSNLQNCQNKKEEFHVAKPYGPVKWQHQKLQADGTYAPSDNVTYINKLSTGQVTPYTVCF